MPSEVLEGFEPATVEEGSPMDFLNPSYLSDGVEGYAVKHGDLIYISLIAGRGDGKVGRLINSFSSRCRIVNVTSLRLRDMLVRRGWKYTLEPAPMGDLDVWAAPKEEVKDGKA